MSYNCFVPNILIDIVKNNIEHGNEHIEPMSMFLTGVCLIVDISGFTKLSGTFCNLGKDGIDQLQLATNGYMGKLVDIINEWGGEIIKFAGDAILCVFPCQISKNHESTRSNKSNRIGFDYDDDSIHDHASLSNVITECIDIKADVILCAMQCAEQLRNIQTEKLSVHIGMSCGEMCFGILGGYENYWECLISGPCIQEISSCLDDAPSKHVAISNSCAQILLKIIHNNPLPPTTTTTNIIDSNTTNDTNIKASLHSSRGNCTISMMPLPSGNYLIQNLNILCGLQTLPTTRYDRHNHTMDNNTSLSEVIKQFVPVPIADQLESGTGLSYLAEIREVTTMFMKVRVSCCSISCTYINIALRYF